jgi:Ser/Thr protein kinase RdoA (MazF antagonist)
MAEMSDDAHGGARGTRAGMCAALREYLIDQYALDAGSAFQDLGGGSNLNLKVIRDGQDCVIRVYRPWFTKARLSAIHELQRALGGEIRTPQKLPARQGAPFCMWENRLVEMEEYIPFAQNMNRWDELIVGMRALGRMHARWAHLAPDLRADDDRFVNYIPLRDALPRVLRACARIRGWEHPTDAEREVAALSETLARMVDAHAYDLPRQPVHGDFWDNNVLFSNDALAFVTDFDFAGMRNRIDDVALTLYFADAQFMLFDPFAGDRIKQLRRMLRAYDEALDRPLTDAEWMALPYALARQPLWGIGNWALSLDEETAARAYVQDMGWYLKWGISMVENADGWREAVRGSFAR